MDVQIDTTPHDPNRIELAEPPDETDEQGDGAGLADDLPDDLPDEVPIVIPLADHATLSRATAADDLPADDFSKTEQALLDLASASMTVGKALEIIPEPEADVRAALTGLIAMGAIAIR